MMITTLQLEEALNDIGLTMRVDFGSQEIHIYSRPTSEAPEEQFHQLEFCGHSIFDVMTKLANLQLTKRMNLKDQPLGLDAELSDKMKELFANNNPV